MQESNNTLKNSYGRPPLAKSKDFKKSIIDFVFVQLIVWREKTSCGAQTAENRCTEDLCRFLSTQAHRNSMNFSFFHQPKQGTFRSCDFSAISLKSNEPATYNENLMLFEAKRLPAPAPNAREKEYLTGSKLSGGVQRFKKGVHGAGHNTAVMVGYIQKYNAEYHFKQLNEWIKLFCTKSPDDLTWSEDECLTLISNTQPTAHLVSKHMRINSKPIVLSHLWVELNVLV